MGRTLVVIALVVLITSVLQISITDTIVIPASAEISSNIDSEDLDNWVKRGYDDDGSFYFKRPSMTFEPPDTPFEPAWDRGFDHEGSDTKWQWAFTGNLDNDSCLETVIKGVDHFFAVDDTGEILFDRPAPRHSTLNLVQDADGDGISEIFFSVRGVENETPRMDVFDRIGNLLKRFEFESFRGGSLNDGTPEIWKVEDIDNDGEIEVILALHASYDRYPRGIVCIGYDSWVIEDNYRFAAHVSNMIFPDLDGDGVKEIVFGTSASLNGAVIPATGSNDWNSYVVALKYNGRNFQEYWRYVVPRDMFNPMNFHTMVSSLDYDGDGRIEILGYLGDKIVEQSSDHGYLFLLEGRTNNRNGELIDQYKTPYPWVRPAGVADVDNDGHLETVIVGDMLGLEDDYIAVFDLVDWKIQSQMKLPDTEDNWTHRPVGINDINGDGQLEIITCIIKTGEVIVFNSDLEEIWSCDSNRGTSTALISDIIPGGVNEIIVIGNRITLLTLEVELELHKVSPPENENYLFPGEEIEFKVDLENTGDLTWVVEISLVEEFDGILRFRESIPMITPRPGTSDTLSFTWAPSNLSELVDLSIVVNITQIRDGIRQFAQKVTWRIWVIAEELMARILEIEWNCPSETCVCQLFSIDGTVRNTIVDRAEVKGPVRKKILERIKIIQIRIMILDIERSIEISPLGGDFILQFESPEDPGDYNVELEITTKEGNVGLREVRHLSVKVEETDHFPVQLLLLLLIPGIALSGYIVRRKWKGRRVFPFFPFFSRERDISENEVRMNIYNLILERPGMTPQQIRKELGIKNYRTVRYHLEKLEEREMVLIRKDALRSKLLLCYPDEDRRIEPFYLSEAQKILLSIINENPNIRRKDIAQMWPYSQGYLTRCLQELQDSNWILNSENNYNVNQEQDLDLEMPDNT